MKYIIANYLFKYLFISIFSLILCLINIINLEFLDYFSVLIGMFLYDLGKFIFIKFKKNKLKQ